MRANGATPFFSVLLLAAAVLAGGCYWHGRTDDSHITFRYGGNIARGAGWVYNEGERVPGSTSPLWTLISAASSSAGLDPAATAMLLGIAFTFLTAMLIFRLLIPELGALPAATAALLCELNTLNATASGLEFSLLVFFGVLAIALYLRGRRMASAIVLALMILTRADGILLAAVLLADSCVRRRCVPWREALLGAAVMLPWFVFSRAYFGSFLPHTLEAKSAQLESGFWFYSYTQNAGRMMLAAVRGNPLHALVLPLAFYGLFKRGTALALLLSWCGLYALAYAMLGVPGYPWYYLIPSYGIGILSAAGASVVAGKGIGGRLAAAVLLLIFCASIVVYPMGSALRAAGKTYIDTKLRAAPQNHPAEFYYGKADEMLASMRKIAGVGNPPIAFTAAVILFGFLLCQRGGDRGRAVWPAAFCVLLLLPRLGDFELLARSVPSQRALAYTRIGEWMRGNLPPRSRVAMGEIGIVGYRSGLPILDLGGIVSPAIARDLAAGDRTSWLYRYQPDYVLLQDLWVFDEPVRELAYFREGYAEVRAWPKGDGLVARLYKKVRDWEGPGQAGQAGAAVAQWDFRRPGDAGRWKPFNPRETSPAGTSPHGYPRYAACGDDSSLAIDGLSIAPARVARMELRLKITPRFMRRRAGVAYLEWGEKGGEGYSPERRASFATKANGRFMTYEIVLSGNYAWRRAGTITSLKIDPTDIDSEIEWESVELLGPPR